MRRETQYLNYVLSNNKRLFFTLLLFRLINALFIQTSYVPDQYWQSIEIAHKWVFGYGSSSWEWYPQIALRSPVHPFLISIIYRLMSIFHLDQWWWLMVKAPQFWHSLLAALVDYHLYQLVLKLVGKETAKWTLFHQLFNWFTFYCAPRTLSNCLEWYLVCVGLTHYPWNLLVTSKLNEFKLAQSRIFVFIVICSIAIRPTTIIIWLPFGCTFLYTTYRHFEQFDNIHKHSKLKMLLLHLKNLIQVYSLTLFVCLIGVGLIERWAYGRWTLSVLNFLYFNVLANGARLYGIQPYHWYFTQGIVAMLLSQLLFLVHTLITFTLGRPIHIEPRNRTLCQSKADLPNRTVRIRRAFGLIGCVVCWSLLCYSLFEHKEFRFIFSIIPLAMCLCGLSSFHICYTSKPRSNHRYLAVICLVLCTHIPVAMYTSLVHQRGPLDILSKLHFRIERDIGKRIYENYEDIHVLSLMPCHTLPSIGQLSCDPNLQSWLSQKDQVHVDEADVFYDDPLGWLHKNYAWNQNESNLPHYIIMFSHLGHHDQRVINLLTSVGYQQCAQVFFAHFLTHSRHGKYILLFCA